MSYIATKGGPMIWYPARVLLPVGIVAGLILGCAHGRAATQRDAAADPDPAPPPPSSSTVTADDIATPAQALALDRLELSITIFDG